MIKRCSIILFLCFTIKLVFSQVYFSKRYPVINHWGGGAFNVIENVEGYFMIGAAISSFTGKQNIIVTQTDFDGNVLFQKNYEDTSYSYYMGSQGSLQKVSSGGYVMYGSKNDGGGSNDLLYRFTEEGDTLWTKQLADSARYIGRQVKETPDGGFICIGDRYTDVSMQIYLIKTDSLGNKEWEQNYGGLEWDRPTSISVCNDGGYIYTSSTKNGGVGLPKENIRIMKVDSVGNIVFNKFFGGIESDNAWSIIQTQDGGYLFGGNYTFLDGSCNCLKSNPYVIKLDILGDTVWTKKYGQAMNAATVLNMSELNDGSIILCGLTRFENQTSGDSKTQGLVFKITSDGDSLFYKLYRLLSSSSSHELRDIKPTSDGGFIASGVIFVSPPDTGTQDMWLLKLDSLGCADTACALATVVEETKEISFGDFKVYPNPAHSFITVELQHPISVVNFKLIDLTGKQILIQQLNTSYTQINVHELPKGIYFYELISEKERYSGKLVIQ